MDDGLGFVGKELGHGLSRAVAAREIIVVTDDGAAFANSLRANAALTAHLSSLRDVQEIQDDALNALHVKELRDQVNAGLIAASDRSSQALDELKKANGLGH